MAAVGGRLKQRYAVYELQAAFPLFTSWRNTAGWWRRADPGGLEVADHRLVFPGPNLSGDGGSRRSRRERSTRLEHMGGPIRSGNPPPPKPFPHDARSTTGFRVVAGRCPLGPARRVIVSRVFGHRGPGRGHRGGDRTELPPGHVADGRPRGQRVDHDGAAGEANAHAGGGDGPCGRANGSPLPTRSGLDSRAGGGAWSRRARGITSGPAAMAILRIWPNEGGDDRQR